MSVKDDLSVLLQNLFFFIVASLFLFSCGTKKPKPEPDWVYQPKSIKISYHADNMLNEFLEAIFIFCEFNKFIDIVELIDKKLKFVR